MIELYDWEGVLLGKAKDWRWPYGQRSGSLRELRVHPRQRDRIEVMAFDQAPVLIRIVGRTKGDIKEVGGRLDELSTGEMLPEVGLWRYSEALIVITGSMD